MKLIGLNKVLKELEQFGETAKKGIARATLDAATTIEEGAIRRVPVDNGKIAQSINKTADTPYHYTINVNASYGAYVEFGTGAMVQVPDEWRDLAWQFYVNGQGMLKPQPYLYPAYQAGRKEYEEKLNKLLPHLKSKYG